MPNLICANIYVALNCWSKESLCMEPITSKFLSYNTNKPGSNKTVLVKVSKHWPAEVNSVFLLIKEIFFAVNRFSQPIFFPLTLHHQAVI